MWSIVYAQDGSVYKIGPYQEESSAMDAAKKAQANGEFDVNEQFVYLLAPDHQMTSLDANDLGIW